MFDAMTTIHSLRWLPVRQRVILKTIGVNLAETLGDLRRIPKVWLGQGRVRGGEYIPPEEGSGREN